MRPGRSGVGRKPFNLLMSLTAGDFAPFHTLSRGRSPTSTHVFLAQLADIFRVKLLLVPPDFDSRSGWRKRCRGEQCYDCEQPETHDGSPPRIVMSTTILAGPLRQNRLPDDGQPRLVLPINESMPRRCPPCDRSAV